MGKRSGGSVGAEETECKSKEKRMSARRSLIGNLRGADRSLSQNFLVPRTFPIVFFTVFTLGTQPPGPEWPSALCGGPAGHLGGHRTVRMYQGYVSGGHRDGLVQSYLTVGVILNSGGHRGVP